MRDVVILLDLYSLWDLAQQEYWIILYVSYSMRQDHFFLVQQSKCQHFKSNSNDLSLLLNL